MKKKTGLVFAGGGAKGSYQIGVWKALDELGMKFDCVIGTSVGALNAALYAMGKRDAAEALWDQVDLSSVVGWRTEGTEPPETESIIRTDLFLLSRYIRDGAFSIDPLRRLIEENIDEARVRASGIETGLVTFNLSDMRPHVAFLEGIPEGRLTDWLLASACLPAYEPIELDGKKFIDGAVYDNMPIEPLYLRGCRRIVAVDISGIGIVRSFEAQDLELVRIRASDPLGGTLQFSRELSRRNMKTGYRDALKKFGAMGGVRYDCRCLPGGCRLAIRPETDLNAVQRRIMERMNGLCRRRVLGRLQACTGEGLTLLNGACEIVAGLFGFDQEPEYALDAFVTRLVEALRTHREQMSRLDRRPGERLTHWLGRLTAEPDLDGDSLLQAQAWATSRQLESLSGAGAAAFAALEALAFANPDVFIAAMLMHAMERGFDLLARLPLEENPGTP